MSCVCCSFTTTYHILCSQHMCTMIPCLLQRTAGLCYQEHNNPSRATHDEQMCGDKSDKSDPNDSHGRWNVPWLPEPTPEARSGVGVCKQASGHQATHVTQHLSPKWRSRTVLGAYQLQDKGWGLGTMLVGWQTDDERS